MNIRDLEYVCAVAELQHFGRAAEKCCVSQPTLSGQIKKLEKTLGVSLFERTNRRVVLTDIGLDIIARARLILQEVEHIQFLAENSHNPLSGQFRLGAFPTLASYIFPSLVADIKAGMPDLRLVLVEDKTAVLLEKLRKGEIDAALLALPVEDDFLEHEKLFTDNFFLAVPPVHPLAFRDCVTQDDLLPYKLLLLEEGHCLRDQALEVCQLSGLNEEQDFRATSLETLRQMVKAGTGITFMPEIAMLEGEGGIAYVSFAPPVPSRTIGLFWRKTSAKMSVIENVVGLFSESLLILK